MNRININKISSSKVNTYFIGILLAFSSLIFLYPFFWVLMSSLKTTNEIYVSSFSLPKIFHFENYVEAWTKAKIGRYFFNSVFLSLVSVVFTVLMALTTSYALVRVYPNKFKFLHTYIALGLLIPLQAIAIPVFSIFKNLNLINNYISVIAIYAVSGFSLAFFIMVGFLKSIPKELEEAAFIDGCNVYQIFWHIMLPIMKPAIASVSILTFLNFWNEYLFASLLITNQDMRTLTQGLMGLKGVYTTDYAVMMGGLGISIIPVVIVYSIFQKQIQSSVTAGALKG